MLWDGGGVNVGSGVVLMPRGEWGGVNVGRGVVIGWGVRGGGQVVIL